MRKRSSHVFAACYINAWISTSAEDLRPIGTNTPVKEGPTQPTQREGERSLAFCAGVAADSGTEVEQCTAAGVLKKMLFDL